jgi:hypothetical protein
MKKVAPAILVIGLCFGSLEAFSQTAAISPCAACRGAPAPLIGAGVPALAAVGGGFLFFKFWRRKRSKNARD